MNLPEAEYCNFCGKAIGSHTLERIRQRKRDFVMIGMEMDLGILDDCFEIVLKKMVRDEISMKWHPISQDDEKKETDAHQTSDPHPKKRGRKPKMR